MNPMCRFLKDEKGVTVIEYALIASLIAMVIVGAITGVGEAVVALFEQVANGFPD